jgi:hypothetical protein
MYLEHQEFNVCFVVAQEKPVYRYTSTVSSCDICTTLLGTIGKNMQPLVVADHLLKGNVNSTEHPGDGGGEVDTPRL